MSSTSTIFQISLLFFITNLLLSVLFPEYVCAYDGYDECSKSFSCGNFTNIGYPFWTNGQPEYCGHPAFRLDCEGDNVTIDIISQKYHVINVSYDYQILKIARTDYWSSICPKSFVNITLNMSDFFNTTANNEFATLLYDCDPTDDQAHNKFSCPINDRVVDFYFTAPTLTGHEISARCNISLLVPVLNIAIERFIDFSMTIEQVIKEGFEVKWNLDAEECFECTDSGGKCGYNRTLNDFTCFCPDQPYSTKCGKANQRNIKVKLLVGFTAGIIGTATACIIVCIYRWKKISSILLKLSCGKISKSDQDIEAFIRNYGSLAPKRYIYSDVKKMTNSFKDKVGQGGYGSVYKGKLPDGSLVAVKLLNTSKGNGQEFINEVASISRTSHVNVVTLLGYCFEDSKRALIYEFMPNGSLEKFIENGDITKSTQHLEWEKMYEIIAGIARGLEYLHRGCNTRILHLDIKPHNILLDADFCPKISDFGLAKLCLNKESIVSMLEARGTIGYIAPEVFSRYFGEVSHKSDVYSYGMMILELVGCKNNLDAGDGNSSEIYFPYWVYRRVEEGKEFKLPGVVTSAENEIAKKMIMVGLWCIQARPSDRPPMNKVIEMLQLSIEDLQIPPKPFLSSPPRLDIYSSTSSLS